MGTDGSTKLSTEVPPPTKRRKIRCKLCDNTFSSVKGLNTHHHKDHSIVQCPKCGKYFSTQSSLDKHSYSHREAKYSCELCGKCFQFESRLNQHMVTHITKKLPCPKKSCDREFKNIGDLNHHMNVHTKGGWYYCDKCSYKNKDKRNVGKKGNTVCSSNVIGNKAVSCKHMYHLTSCTASTASRIERYMWELPNRLDQVGRFM